jgi:peptidoglycan-N-acetylglucosamine deacetylase
MRATNFSTQSVFKGLSGVFKIRFDATLKGHPALFFKKRSKYIWAAICLSVAISYNSCGIHLSKNRKENEMATTPEKDSRSLAQDTIAKAKEKTIYLSFDDGPNKGTANVMRVLNEANVPATFFLVGSHIHGSEKQWTMFQDILSTPKFEAANHTYYHAKNRYNQFYKNPQLALDDFRLMRDSVHLTTHIGRTPGCNVWRTSEITCDIDRRSTKAANLLKTNDFTLVGWDVEWKANAKTQFKSTPAELAAEIEKHFAERLTKTDDHLVVLLHDQHFVDSNNVRALEELIGLLKGEYGFGRVSGYPCL